MSEKFPIGYAINVENHTSKYITIITVYLFCNYIVYVTILVSQLFELKKKKISDQQNSDH